MLEGNQISRRTFLKSTGVVGTSALVAGLGVGSLMQPTINGARSSGVWAGPSLRSLSRFDGRTGE